MVVVDGVQVVPDGQMDVVGIVVIDDVVVDDVVGQIVVVV